jgi:hypothetical protein
MLPGFQNAFMPSSPVRSSQTRDGKGKEREVYSDSMGKGKRISFLKYPSQFASDLPPPSSPPSSPTLQRARAARADVNMREVSYDRDAPSGNLEEEDIEMIEDGSDMMSLETQDEFEPINWRAEACLSIF